MMRKNLFVFDIETVPDLEAAGNLLGKNDDAEALKQALVDYHLALTGGKNSFFRQPFHKVVAISFLEAEIEYTEHGEYYHLKDIRSGCDLKADEKEIIKAFFRYLAGKAPRLVSFNGKTFDLPVLKYRAMRHGVQAPWLYQSGDKWNNYNTKFALDWHCDLIDAFSDYGASARIKMDEVCALFGLPGKIETEGSMVDEMYQAGQIKEIRDYCELDVANTYLLYLRYMHHTAKLSDSAYNKMTDDLLTFFKNDQREHFQLFLQKWDEVGVQYVDTKKVQE